MNRKVKRSLKYLKEYADWYFATFPHARDELPEIEETAIRQLKQAKKLLLREKNWSKTHEYADKDGKEVLYASSLDIVSMSLDGAIHRYSGMGYFWCIANGMARCAIEYIVNKDIDEFNSDQKTTHFDILNAIDVAILYLQDFV